MGNPQARKSDGLKAMGDDPVMSQHPGWLNQSTATRDVASPTGADACLACKLSCFLNFLCIR
ncbi:hypothetical protein ASPSYDRAFT_52368 [Aspergillus sydowii CBS 593.65]|uniref:Uncharacterized protein n=1 Tax=Aspergillus sydowii CBS 593.65 TaxID=1036612 RepID=A0A1L9SYI4_9EURO|nr:uncharacterized protein ASPSYDRAFT_52368 [Aspergillus sydowii CBS 593.65]OJJ52141.1 hypothetical protein ASPSYDRAFT_52368 [Aspergillus sydowii CBS 593.65]